jgi:hypothetical protein
VESGFGLRKANASFVTVEFIYSGTSHVPSKHAFLLPVKTFREQEWKKERKEEEEVNISMPVIQLQGKQRIDRSIDRRISGPGPGTVCETG